MSALEEHYRRLVALYPSAHRTRYQEEMIATLMDGAGQGQRLPRWREILDLLWNAVRLRVSRGADPRPIDPRWPAAAGVFAPLAALVIGVLYIHLPLGRAAWHERVGAISLDAEPLTWVPVGFAVAWFVIALLAFVAWHWQLPVVRAFAVLGALAVTAVHMVPHLGQSVGQHGRIAAAWPMALAGVTVALCLLPPMRRTPLSPWRFGLFVIIAAVFGGSLWVDVMIADVTLHGRSGARIGMWGGQYAWPVLTDDAGVMPVLVFVAFVAMTVWTLVHVGGPIRRRVLAIAAMPIMMYAVVEWMYSSTWRTMTAAQWLALFLLPVVALGAGVLVVRWRDHGRG